MHALHPLDTTIVVFYLVGTLLVGTVLGRAVRNSRDFFLAGKTLPFWAIGMSIVVTDIGATDFIAVAGGTYHYGIAQANFDWLGSMPALLVAAFLFVPLYWRTGVFTVPEFLGRRYGDGVRMILAAAWSLILVMNLGIMLHATAILLRGVLGWPPAVSIWVTAGVVGIYSMAGGLAAVVMTDVLQLVVMFVGGAVLVVRVLWEVGGPAGLRAGIEASPQLEHHLSLYLPHDTPTPLPWTGIVFGLGIVLSTAYFTGNQAVVLRALGARSEWDAKAGMLVAGVFKLAIPLLVAVPGLVAAVLLPGLERADDAVPALIRAYLPAGLRGLMLAAFLAALMSSIDSFLNSASTLVTQDLVGRPLERRGRPLSDRAALRIGRVVTFAALVLSTLIAPQVERRFPNIYTAIQSVFSLVQGPTLAILLLGLLWRRINRWGGLVGLTTGIALCAALNSAALAGLFPSEQPFLFVAWWSFLFTLAVTTAVSLATPADRDTPPGLLLFERVRREHFGDPAP